MRVVAVHDNNTVETLDIDQSLSAMQRLVGDGEKVWVQAIKAGNVTYWCDEEIKFKPHNINVLATGHLLRTLHREGRTLMPGDYLGGTVVVTGGATPDGNNYSIPKSAESELTLGEW